MQPGFVETLAMCRAAAGYLGERAQHGWWSSGFFEPSSRAFLAPVFGRTIVLAQCSGVTQAAALVHDERIGVGRVYHLFRLPEDVEQGIHQALQRPAVIQRIATLVTSTEAAVQHLREIGRTTSAAHIGPMRIGDARSMRDAGAWRAVAAQYAHAFTTGNPVFPFFADQP